MADFWHGCLIHSIGKQQSLQQMVLNNWTVPWKRMKFDSYLTLFTKIYSKWINDLNLRAKTIKLIEKNKGVNRHDLGFCNGLLDVTLEAWETRKNKVDFIKIKIYAWEDMIKRVKRKPMEWDKIFVCHISYESLISRIYI